MKRNSPACRTPRRKPPGWDALANGHGTEEAPRWRFTQKFTSLQPVMQFADSDGLRRKMWEGSCSIGKDGEYDNEALIAEILELRDKKAHLLGMAALRTTPPPAAWPGAEPTP